MSHMKVLTEGVSEAGLMLSEEQMKKLSEYVDGFMAWSKVHNLTSFKESSAMVEALVLPSIRSFKYTMSYDVVIDWGSGGGIPGVVLAILNPGLKVILVERVQKKCVFLNSMVHTLLLDSVEVVDGDFSDIFIEKPKETAIFCRGACKLDMQLSLSAGWRKKGVKLFSFQPEKTWRDVEGVGSYVIKEHSLHGQGLVLLEVD